MTHTPGTVPELRDYQTRGREDIRQEMQAGNRRVIYCLPTGAGKTTVAADMIRNRLTDAVAARRQRT